MMILDIPCMVAAQARGGVAPISLHTPDAGVLPAAQPVPWGALLLFVGGWVVLAAAAGAVAWRRRHGTAPIERAFWLLARELKLSTAMRSQVRRLAAMRDEKGGLEPVPAAALLVCPSAWRIRAARWREMHPPRHGGDNRPGGVPRARLLPPLWRA